MTMTARRPPRTAASIRAAAALLLSATAATPLPGGVVPDTTRIDDGAAAAAGATVEARASRIAARGAARDRGGGRRHREPVDVDRCRRNPTWRRRAGRDGVGSGGAAGDGGGDGADELFEACRALAGRLGAHDPERLATAGRHPMLSSDSDASSRTGAGDGEKGGYDRLPAMERPLLRTLAECVDSAAAADDDGERPDASPVPAPSIVKMHKRKDGRGPPVMALVSHALSEQEADAVLRLSSCVQRHVPDLFERRAFEDTDGGGNDVAYLAGFLQLLLPGVATQLTSVLRTVWDEAGWWEDDAFFRPIDWVPAAPGGDDRAGGGGGDEYEGTSRYSTRWWPDPVEECGIRTSEHLSYDTWGSLGYHQDHGSDYTVLVSLSDPSDYEGGEFTILPSKQRGDRISIKPERLSAIVFLSEAMHGVEKIEGPGRQTFATEFWRYGDVPAMNRRPPQESMVFGDPMNQFVLKDDEDGEDGGGDGVYDDEHYGEAAYAEEG